MRGVSVSLLLLLSACAAAPEPAAETYWRYAGAAMAPAEGQERLSRDEAACSAAAYQHATAFLASGDPVFASCMRSRGWVRVG